MGSSITVRDIDPGDKSWLETQRASCRRFDGRVRSRPYSRIARQGRTLREAFRVLQTIFRA